MVSISDTRCDAGWSARIRGNWRNSSKGLAMNRSPRNRVIRSEQAVCSRHAVNMIPGSAWTKSGVLFSYVADGMTGSLYRHLRKAWREESRGRLCACSKVAIYFSGRIAPRSPRSSGFLQNEEDAERSGLSRSWTGFDSPVTKLHLLPGIWNDIHWRAIALLMGACWELRSASGCWRTLRPHPCSSGLVSSSCCSRRCSGVALP